MEKERRLRNGWKEKFNKTVSIRRLSAESAQFYQIAPTLSIPFNPSALFVEHQWNCEERSWRLFVALTGGIGPHGGTLSLWRCINFLSVYAEYTRAEKLHIVGNIHNVNFQINLHCKWSIIAFQPHSKYTTSIWDTLITEKTSQNENFTHEENPIQGKSIYFSTRSNYHFNSKRATKYSSFAVSFHLQLRCYLLYSKNWCQRYE